MRDRATHSRRGRRIDSGRRGPPVEIRRCLHLAMQIPSQHVLTVRCFDLCFLDLFANDSALLGDDFELSRNDFVVSECHICGETRIVDCFDLQLETFGTIGFGER